MKIKFRKANDLDVFLVFRWLIFLSIILMAIYATEEVERIGLIYKIAFSYFMFNLFLRIWRLDILINQMVLFLLFFFDIIIVSIVFYYTGSISSDYFIFYFLTIMMASISSGIVYSIPITIVSVGVYVWLLKERSQIDFQDPLFLLKIVFLLLTAFISSLWNKIMKERIEEVKTSEEKEKEEIEVFYKEIISSINSGIIIFEDDNNKMLVRLINPKAKELIRKDKKVFSIIEECVKEAQISLENKHLVKVENGKYWGINLTILRDSSGKGKGAIVVFNDITDRKRLEKEMERSERINRLGRLTLQIAHDLRNPLGSISGLAQLLSISSKEEKDREYAKEILKASNIINGLIGDMLEFSRDQVLEKRTFDFLSFIEEIIEDLKRSENVKGKKAKISLIFEKGDYKIEADREKLRRVFVNLINNACDAISEGGEINVEMRENSKSIITKVIDNGVGIPEEKKDEIFEPFITTKPNGTGLGLSIVQRIVSAHKGKIFVDSKVGEGSIFTVELPKKGGENA
ncbi:MAG: ATP-binding protein [candidate division WOR-3 bacterium]